MRPVLELVGGDRRLGRDLHDLGRRVENPRSAFERLLADLHTLEREQFASHGHGRWPELKASTRRQKQAAGHDKGPLRATDKLFNSLTAGGTGAKEHIAGDVLLFGTTIFYARFHKDRPPIDFTAGDRRGILRKLRDYLLADLRR